MIYLSPNVILTRNYAYNHRKRAVDPTTQLCETVCKCSMELHVLPVLVTTELSWLTMHLWNTLEHNALWPSFAFINYRKRFKKYYLTSSALGLQKIQLMAVFASLLNFVFLLLCCESICRQRINIRQSITLLTLHYFDYFFRVYCFCFASCT